MTTYSYIKSATCLIACLLLIGCQSIGKDVTVDDSSVTNQNALYVSQQMPTQSYSSINGQAPTDLNQNLAYQNNANTSASEYVPLSQSLHSPETNLQTNRSNQSNIANSDSNSMNSFVSSQTQVPNQNQPLGRNMYPSEVRADPQQFPIIQSGTVQKINMQNNSVQSWNPNVQPRQMNQIQQPATGQNMMGNSTGSYFVPGPNGNQFSSSSYRGGQPDLNSSNSTMQPTYRSYQTGSFLSDTQMSGQMSGFRLKPNFSPSKTPLKQMNNQPSRINPEVKSKQQDDSLLPPDKLKMPPPIQESNSNANNAAPIIPTEHLEPSSDAKSTQPESLSIPNNQLMEENKAPMKLEEQVIDDNPIKLPSTQPEKALPIIPENDLEAKPNEAMIDQKKEIDQKKDDQLKNDLGPPPIIPTEKKSIEDKKSDAILDSLLKEPPKLELPKPTELTIPKSAAQDTTDKKEEQSNPENAPTIPDKLSLPDEKDDDQSGEKKDDPFEKLNLPKKPDIE